MKMGHEESVRLDQPQDGKTNDSELRKACKRFDELAEEFKRDNLNFEEGRQSEISKNELVREYFMKLSRIYRLFNAPANWNKAGEPKEALPRNAAFVAGQIIDDLVAGRRPSSIEHLFFAGGRPGWRASQRRAVETAVRYIGAATIVDPATKAIARVAREYGVGEECVRSWQRKISLDSREIDPIRTSSGAEYLSMLERHMIEEARIYRNSRNLKV